jgi:hypothetical protein
MIRALLALLITFACVGSQAVPAAVLSRDWKMPGDGLLTYDDVNQREWLDLSETLLTDQFPGSDPSPLIAREMRYQFVVSQTASGGLFEGFSVAKSTDVIQFAQSAGRKRGRSSFFLTSRARPVSLGACHELHALRLAV